MKRTTSAVRLLTDPAYTPGSKPSRADNLRASLLAASRDALAFAQSSEVKDNAQRQRYVSLSESLRAQVNSLRAEVADAESR
jgi:putative hemolysin